MIEDKPAQFLSRAIDAMVHWENSSITRPDIVHIHGMLDHTLPFKNIQQPTHVVPDGSHAMIMANSAQLNKLLRQELSADKIQR
jgi:hypothetical protein